MASRIKIKKGLDIPLMGEPQEKFLGEVKSDVVKICPEDFIGVTPKLSVRVGDEVKAGDALMYDRNHPSIKVASPISGVVTAIDRGEKRRILNITVERKGENGEPIGEKAVWFVEPNSFEKEKRLKHST